MLERLEYEAAVVEHAWLLDTLGQTPEDSPDADATWSLSTALRSRSDKHLSPLRSLGCLRTSGYNR
ncbi:MAG: hypothetical protein AAFU79_08225 [Myxococcota bacterium]